MAFDVLTRKTSGRSWARGEGSEAGSWASDKAWDRVKESIPWKAVGLAVGVGALGLFVIPRLASSLKAKKNEGGIPHLIADEMPTKRIPHETMRQLVYGKKRGQR